MFTILLYGAAAAGPLYAAFPIAATLLKKGARLTNVFIFLGAWSTTKIPMLLFEASSLSAGYMLLRLGFNIVGILFIALLLNGCLTKRDKRQLRDRAEGM